MQTGGATWWSTDQKGGKTRVNFPPTPCDLSPASSMHSPRPGTFVTSPSTQRGCGSCSGSPSSNGMASDWKAAPFAFQSLLCPTFGALQKSSTIIALIFGRGSLDTSLFSVFASACSPHAGKVSTCNVGDLGSIPGLGRSHGERNSYLLQYSGLENSMDCIVHGVTMSQT